MSIVKSGWMAERKPAIGMVHLRPLPGSPVCEDTLAEILAAALRDAEAIVEGGMDGLLLENLGDAPYYPDSVPPITIACMTAVASELRRRFEVPIGINVLRNDARAALAIALAAGASFIRVNILSGARVTDQGILSGQAHLLMRDRRQWGGGEAVQVWADVQVKHSGPLAPRPLQDEVAETLLRGQADAVIVTGTASSHPASLRELSEAKQAAGESPVLVGSGVTADNLGERKTLADGFIVGSALKELGQLHRPVDPAAVRRFVAALRSRS